METRTSGPDEDHRCDEPLHDSGNFRHPYIVNKMINIMKTVAVIALALLSLSASATAQTSASFTGKWEGTFTLQRPDGTAAEPRPFVFNITQTGQEITGTAGPADQQEQIDKGVVADGKATFQVQVPDGPLFKFSLSIVKGHLQGDMTGERDGEIRGRAKIDATKATKTK